MENNCAVPITIKGHLRKLSSDVCTRFPLILKQIYQEKKGYTLRSKGSKLFENSKSNKRMTLGLIPCGIIELEIRSWCAD